MKTDITWKVYMHTLPKEVSGYMYDKRYVGITSNAYPKNRWKNGNRYKYSDEFYSDIQKFGWDSIEHEILAIWDNENDGFESEKRFIELLETRNPEKGYNKSTGGKGPFGLFGEKNSNFGNNYSESVRKKLSENHADFKLGNNPNAKKTYQFDTNYNFVAEYGAMTEAAITNGYKRSCIGKAITNHQLSYGYFWVYEDDVVIRDGIPCLKNKFEIPSRGQKEVYQFDKYGDFIEKYPSCSAAGEATGVHSSNISAAARHLHQFVGGFQWRYKDDVVELENSGIYQIVA